MPNRMPCEIESCAGITGTGTGGARGLCSKHYNRMKRYGDPHYVTPREAVYGSLEERLWAKVEKTDTCWLWTGGIHPTGYGRLRNSPGWVSVHRLSYELHHGDIPDGLFVLHSCDVRRCVNPDHLRVGTAADNSRDCVERGRQSRKASRPKLTEADVKAIRRRHAAGERMTPLALEYGVKRAAVWHVVTRRTWRDVA